MKVVCAWCQQERKPALLREVEPLDDQTETHAVCSLHQLRLMERMTVMQHARHGPGAPAMADALARPGGSGPGPDASGPSASVELRELERARRQLGTWVVDSQTLLQRVFPRLIEGCDQVTRRAEAAEQICAELRQRVAKLHEELAALETERSALAEARARTIALLQRLTADTSQHVLQPLHQLLTRLEKDGGRD